MPGTGAPCSTSSRIPPVAHNYDKLWVQQTLNEGATRRAQQMVQRLGRALPCRVTAISGALVTVSFEMDSAPYTLPQITIPKAESNWIRMPTQVGDLGVTMPADVYLDGITGQGGTANLTQPGNLAALVFVPVSSKSSPPSNGNAAIVQGPEGVIAQTTQGTTSSVVINQSGTTLTFGSTTIVMNSSSITLTAGGISLVINGSGITLDGKLWETHKHSGVLPGGGTSGPPV